jgi:protein tyrosine phosphatase (PTP) superfamily phosphohydrolase (DUF442 family)
MTKLRSALSRRNNSVNVLAKQGFKSVVNIRTEGEDEQLLSPGVEGEQARAAGRTYLHIPLSTKAMRSKMFDQFREK